MDLPVHFAASAVLAVLLWPAYGALSLWVFLLGFLIDFDHCLWHFFAHGTIDPRKTYREDKYGKETGKLDIFHTAEFVLVAVIFSWLFLQEIFVSLMAGLASHIILDAIYLYYFIYEPGKPFSRSFSIISWLMARNKNKKAFP